MRHHQMNEQLRYLTFETALGWVGLLASVQGLRAVTLPRPSAEDARQSLERDVNEATWAPEAFADLVKRLQAYYQGYRVTFPDKLDLTDSTPFQQAVWTAAQRIPYGQTHSYGWVANQIGKPRAARAVGQALGHNPLAIIVPCHRVVASDSGLGGFGGGLEMKSYLLELEAKVGSVTRRCLSGTR